MSQEPSAYDLSLPRKRMGAGMLLTDKAGGVLMVRPSYKPGWETPGGVVEADESPLAAARREVLEELALDREPGVLLCVDWMAARSGHSESLTWIFDGGTLSQVDIDSIRLQDGELLGYEFIPPDRLDEQLGAGTPRAGRMLAAVQARARGWTWYLENGRAVTDLRGQRVQP